MSYKANSNIIKVSTAGVVGANGLIVGNPDTTAKDASAALEIESTTGGLLLPRVTTVQRDAISSPSQGLTVYNTDIQNIETKTATDWVAAAGSLLAIKVFSSGTAATYTPSPGTRLIYVEMCGGGGGSGFVANSPLNSQTLSIGSSGSAAMSISALIKVTSATGTYTIGSGGVGGTSGTPTGGNGTNSSFSIGTATLICSGGTGGNGNLTTTGQQITSSTNEKSTGSSVSGVDVLYSKIYNGLGSSVFLINMQTAAATRMGIVLNGSAAHSAYATKIYGISNESDSVASVPFQTNFMFASPATAPKGPGSSPSSGYQYSNNGGTYNGLSGSNGEIMIWEFI